MIYLGFDSKAENYERKVYDILNLFGLVGGFIEVFNIIFSLLASLLLTNLIEAKTVNIFYNETFGHGHKDKLSLAGFGF